MMTYTGERAIPWNKATGALVMTPHIMRYAFATGYCWQRQVVDIATGAGYGAYMLSWVALSVTAVDVSPAAIDAAVTAFKAPNLTFVEGDMIKGLPAGEIYTAFECLEHVPDPAAVLKLVNGRPLVWSIPINDNSLYHERGYTAGEILDMMKPGTFYFQDLSGFITRDNPLGMATGYVIGINNEAGVI